MTIKERVTAVVSDQLSRPDVLFEHKLREELGADSLDMIELVLAIETEFNVEIPEETADKFRTVHDIIFFIEQYQRNR